MGVGVEPLNRGPRQVWLRREFLSVCCGELTGGVIQVMSQSWGPMLTDTGLGDERSGQNLCLPPPRGHGSLLSDLRFCICKVQTRISASRDVEIPGIGTGPTVYFACHHWCCSINSKHIVILNYSSKNIFRVKFGSFFSLLCALTKSTLITYSLA